MQRDNYMDDKIKTLYAFICGAIVSVVFLAAVTVWAEIYPTIKEWLTLTFFHHWVGKSVLGGFVFVGASTFFSFFPLKEKSSVVAQSLRALFWATFLSASLLLLFFISEVVS